MNNRKTRTGMCSVLVTGLLTVLGSNAVAQAVIDACYVERTGVVYLIDPSGTLPGLPSECNGRHVGISWVDGAEAIFRNRITEAIDGFAVTGETDNGSILASGAGTRLMWYPREAAFRAGYVDGDQWDVDNIGRSSVAMGHNATASEWTSTAMGYNTTASGIGSTAMGADTKAERPYAVAMGKYARASASSSTAIGYKTKAEGVYSTAIGSNTTASNYSTAMGDQTMASGEWSTAMGYHASTNGMEGSFAYGDRSTISNVQSPAANSFTVRASGGYYLYSNSGLTAGAVLYPGASSWDVVSDRNLKENFRELDGDQVLDAIAAMSIQSWNYKAQESSIRHVGPMAQDFYAAFGLGTDEKHINTVDIDGVNMLAIQALEERTRTLQAENDTLRDRLAKVEATLLMLLEVRR